MAELNAVSERVLGHVKYASFHFTGRDTGEKFGLEYVEPGCRPVPLDWDKHRSKTDLTPALNPPPQSSPPTAQAELPQSSSSSPAKLFQFATCSPAVKPDVTPSSTPEPQTRPETRSPLSLPLLSSPSGARTGPVKTDYVPSIFAHKEDIHGSQKLERYQRSQGRQSLVVSIDSPSIEVSHVDHEEECTVVVGTDLSMADIDQLQNENTELKRKLALLEKKLES
ncbi:hypothetical protein PFLUV_G00248710 [Perca fluviatilis]|uniref:Uncharacterized protein n=1 Tax=Perca fluviatilis TaxID=8168 RepID=A0A6A5EED2_PERFL|nr:hypothetical protein PFLUV_G00248710 [Perca fluviatilis]